MCNDIYCVGVSMSADSACVSKSDSLEKCIDEIAPVDEEDLEGLEEENRDFLTEFKARRYQLEIIEKAKVKNSIVFLGTGTGKTFIAGEVIKRFRSQILGDWVHPLPDEFDERDIRSYRTEFKRTFFLCLTIPLVYQQHAYLEKHLHTQDNKFAVTKVVGSDGVDSWDKTRWLKILKESNVLVMTAQILHDQLIRGFIKMADINLLIFDEAHHASKEDIYNQIMHKYREEKEENPGLSTRILGLTASLLNEKKVDKWLERKLITLMKNFDSEIITARDYVEVSEFCARPDFRVITYKPNLKLDQIHHFLFYQLCSMIKFITRAGNFDSRLVEDPTYLVSEECPLNKAPFVWVQVVNFEIISLLCVKKLAQKLATVVSTLGAWPSYWLAQYITKRIRSYYKEIKDDHVKAASANFLAILKKYLSVFEEPPSYLNVTDKILTLSEELKRACKAEDFCGITFVRDRVIAFILAEYFTHVSDICPELAKLKCSHFTGQAPLPIFPELHFSAKRQMDLLKSFRDGRINFFLATDVLIEGLDVQQCNLVIIFDAIPHFRYFTQSRGRVRAKVGEYVCLAEEKVQDDVANEMAQYDKLEEELRNVVHRICFDETLSSLPQEEKLTYRTKSGATLSLSMAKPLLYQYCQFLTEISTQDKYTAWAPLFKIYKRNDINNCNEFFCTITMPKTCYVMREEVSSQRWVSRKKVAMRYAAFYACKKLLEIGEINDDLMPKYVIFKRENETNLGIVNNNNRRLLNRKKFYPIKLADSILNMKSPFICNARVFYYPIIYENAENSVNLFGIMCGSPFGEFPSELVLNDPNVHCFCKGRLEGPFEIELNSDSIRVLQEFHQLILNILFNIPSDCFEFNIHGCFKKYSIVPILKSESMYFIDMERAIYYLKSQKTSKSNHIPTDLDIHDYRGMRVKKNYDDTYKHAVYEVITVDPSITVNSPFPDQNRAATYAEYFFNRFGISFTDPNQPSLTVEPFKVTVSSYCYFSGPLPEQNEPSPKKLKQGGRGRSIILFPELVNNLSIYQVLTPNLTIIPSFLYKLECYLSACEFLNTIHPNIDRTSLQTSGMLKALTQKKCHENIDLERLEFFGDTCLKFAVGLSLYAYNPTADQNMLTIKKSAAVSNMTLLRIANCEELQLPQYIKSREFLPRGNWLPPQCGYVSLAPTNVSNNDSQPMEVDDIQDNSNIKPKNENNNQNTNNRINSSNSFLTQTIANKSVADSFEAVLGSITMCHGLYPALKFLVTYGNKELFENMDGSVIEFPSLPEPSFNGSERCKEKFRLFLEGGDYFRQIFPITPKCSWNDREKLLFEQIHQKDLIILSKKLSFPSSMNEDSYYILLEALTHDSFSGEMLTGSYQRLEFLGDCVLDYLVTSYLMCYVDQTFQPEDLHKLRAFVVCNRNFARLTVEWELDDYLLYTSQGLQKDIDKYVEYLESIEQTKSAKKSFFKSELEYTLKQKKAKKKQEQDKIDEMFSKVIKAPKALGDVFESVSGALLLTVNYNLETVWQILGPVLEKSIKDFLAVYIPRKINIK